MNFIVSSGALLAELQIVGGIISNNVVVPILENFLFELQGNKLTITGSDMETMIKSSIEVNAEGANSDSDLSKICVPSKIFLEYLKTLPEQPLNFKTNASDFSIEISSDTGKYKIGGEDGKEYPAETLPSDLTSFKIAPKDLADCINKTLFAISNDNLRPAMTGVFMEMSNEGMTFVSTDGHRLVKLTRKDLNCPTEGSIIVPKKPLQQLKNILSDETEANTTIAFNATHLFVENNEMKLTSRLIDGRFPPYRAVIPENNPYTVTVNRNDLLNSLRRVSIFASKSTQQVVFDIKGNSLSISAQDIDFSFEGNETMNCQFNGPDMKMGFNGKLLSEMLGALEGEEIKIELSSPNKAGIYKNTDDEENTDLLMLLMPLMIGVNDN